MNIVEIENGKINLKTENIVLKLKTEKWFETRTKNYIPYLNKATTYFLNTQFINKKNTQLKIISLEQTL